MIDRRFTNFFRSLLIGLLLGGGIGANMGAVGLEMAAQYNWSSIQTGLLIGGILGITVAISISIISSHEQNLRRETQLAQSDQLRWN